MIAQRIKPGRGWKRLSGAVWENERGTRIHLLGFVRLSDGTMIKANKWPECLEAEKYIGQHGGNRKRGLMSWARLLEFDKIMGIRF